ncbi:MAG: ABC transporter permease subunit [Spirochaetia bacterium]|nr:ABC transporter permease subunit [Spirochaetia bacterium]
MRARDLPVGILKACAQVCGVAVLALALAGLPLLALRAKAFASFEEGPANSRETPRELAARALRFVKGLGDGSSFRYRINMSEWNFLELGPRALWVSFVYTAVPGAFGMALGAVAGVASRRRGRALADRATDALLATPDFMLIILSQAAALGLAKLGLRVKVAATTGPWILLPFLVMAVAPFGLSFRAAASEARRAASSDHVTYARSKGLDERTLLRRHIGAGIFPRMAAELPTTVATMQATLFVVEHLFALPGMARMLFNAAFAGPRNYYLRVEYQYDLVVLALLGSILSSALVYLVLGLALRAAREALIHE